jgi:murein DD-endopeptidase MepM/ murein hydrolase activator NlpD
MTRPGIFLRRLFGASLVALLVVPAAEAARSLPVDGTITSGVGWRQDPFGSGRLVYHRGIDISVPTGTAVHPTQEGYVFFSGEYGHYGNLVAVAHGEGYITLYGHNSEVKARVGEWVTPETVIALSGSTGRSTGPHVHYEIRRFEGKEKARQEQVIGAMRENLERTLREEVRPAGGVGG